MAEPAETAALRRLLRLLAGEGSLAVAVSGGVDSAVVLAAAVQARGAGRVLAVHAVGPQFPADATSAAAALAARLGVPLVTVDGDLTASETFRRNPRDRCYRCKRELFARLWAAARDHGAAALVDGSHADDREGERPGLRALVELGVGRPLAAAGLGKAAVRRLAAALRLPDPWRPAQPCLATRVPFGQPVTRARLAAVAAAEAALRGLGVSDCRVRHHGRLARVEVPPADMGLVLAHRDEVVAGVRAAGFTWVALDLAGYRYGSLAEA